MKVKILSPKGTIDYQYLSINGLFPYIGKTVSVVAGNKFSVYVAVKIENRLYSIANNCCKFISFKNKLK